jgi:3-oxoacyl-(acyl-carrier-protein) synthase
VVVTGIGVVAPNGIGKEAFWHATSNGQSGIRLIERISTHDLPIQVAGEVKGFRPEEYLDRKLTNRTDRMTHLALAAVDEALRDAGLALAEEPSHRMGAVIANTFGGVEYVVEQIQALHVRGPRSMSAYTSIAWLQVANVGQISLRYGMQGYCKTPINDTSGGLDALGIAYDAIQRGAADVLVAGGCEAPLHYFVLLALGRSGLLALGDDPAAYRPFDRRASGLILAEGAGICILEEYEHARRRGAHIYGEIVGYAQTNDAHTLHATLLDGKQYALSMTRAMQQGGLRASDIGYVSLDGRALPAADFAEVDALCRVFGPDLDLLPVSIPHTMLGHSYAAAGAINTLAALLALEYAVIPPTINSAQLLPTYPINLIREPCKDVIQSVLIGGRSTGGVNSALAVKKV